LEEDEENSGKRTLSYSAPPPVLFFPNSLPPPPPTPLYTPNPNGLEETSLLIKENLRALFVKKIYLPNSQTI